MTPDGARLYLCAVVAIAEPEDGALMRAVADGDRAALATLYDRHGARLLGLAVRLLGSRARAEDLLHDVILEVWRKAADYDPGRGSVRSWLFLHLRSRALDRLRAARRLEAGETGDDRACTHEVADQLAVRRALAVLPVEHRRVIELGYYEGLSSSEIAARIDAPIGTVKSRVRAALAGLRDALGSP